MLIKITQSCRMGCTHCCESCTPDGEHMSFDTFEQSIKKIKELGAKTVLVSGGEPTDHPYFIPFMEKLITELNGRCAIIVTSNGMFLQDEDYSQKLLTLKCDYQITADGRYYPIKVPNIKHPKLIYETSIRHVVSLGRARENGIEHGVRNGMKCFNVRALCKQLDSIEKAINLLESRGIGYCVPNIDIDGSIKPGEFHVCKTLGTVWDTNVTLTNKFKSMSFYECNNCDDMKHLKEDAKNAFIKL